MRHLKKILKGNSELCTSVYILVHILANTAGLKTKNGSQSLILFNVAICQRYSKR